MQVVSHSLEVMEVRWTSVTMYQPSASSLHPTLPCLHHCYSQSRLIAPLSASLHCNHLPLFPPLSLQVVSHSLEPGGILMPPSPPSYADILKHIALVSNAFNDRSGEILNILPVNDPSNSTSVTMTTPTTTSVTIYHPSL